MNTAIVPGQYSFQFSPKTAPDGTTKIFEAGEYFDSGKCVPEGMLARVVSEGVVSIIPTDTQTARRIMKPSFPNAAKKTILKKAF